MIKKSKTVSNTAVNRMHRATDFNLKSTRTRWGSISIPQPHSRSEGEWGMARGKGRNHPQLNNRSTAQGNQTHWVNHEKKTQKI